MMAGHSGGFNEQFTYRDMGPELKRDVKITGISFGVYARKL